MTLGRFVIPNEGILAKLNQPPNLIIEILQALRIVLWHIS